MRGFVEILDEASVAGWAFDETHPAIHQPVVAYLDGAKIGSAVADRLRADLQVAGVGDGDHGFKVAFIRPVSRADFDRLEIYAGEVDNRFELAMLNGSARQMSDQASDSQIPIADDTQHPVFVLGPARSGTSAVALALLGSGRYAGYGEGHLLSLAHKLVTTIDEHYSRRAHVQNDETFVRNVPSDAFQHMVRRGFIQLSRAMFPDGYWLDKTPTSEMVRAAPLMRELWPNARFIFLKRRIIENIASRRRKFPGELIEHHYHDWADVLQAWTKVRTELGDAAIEIDQFELAKHSDEVGTSISEFLELPAQAHERFLTALGRDRPEKTSDAFGLAESIEGLNLSPAETRKLIEICEPMMFAYGYSYDQRYYRGDDGPLLLPSSSAALEVFPTASAEAFR